MNVRGIYTDTGGVCVGMSWTTRGQILPGSPGADLPVSGDILPWTDGQEPVGGITAESDHG
jgi:hypothetical protein